MIGWAKITVTLAERGGRKMTEHRHSCDAYDAGGACNCGADDEYESSPTFLRDLSEKLFYGLDTDQHHSDMLRVVASQYEMMWEILLSLNLYIGEYEWKQLTTEQKNFFADLIDTYRAENFPEDHEPMERWWQ